MPDTTPATCPAPSPADASGGSSNGTPLPTYYTPGGDPDRYRAWETAGAFRPRPAGPDGDRFAMILPPPNITGSLHMGHAYEHTLSDAIIRYQRMSGAETLWLPGTDHAGIATQALMERQLRAEGTSRHELGRDAFLARTRAWRDQTGETITSQMRRLGASPDWDRSTYTLDPGPALATHAAFTRLFNEGLIYRASRDTSWCTGCETTLADIETETDQAGLLRCTRCQSSIETRSTPQWFLATKTLADKARDAYTSRQLQIDPPELAETYLRWLDDMHDWCLSRQLWWGHQIPIWYSPEGEAHSFAPGEEIPEGWARDEDTLDTWFSSGLWPLSTLGWPTPTADLSRYYPNDLLITGYDLLFFWAIRMLMLCTRLSGTPPFRRLYLHGMIRDANGRKMSKSFGNTIDPLEFIDTYGPDTLRLALTRRARPGADIPFGHSDMSGAQGLLKKLWSIARMAQTYDIDLDPSPIQPAIHPLDRCLASRLTEAHATITAGFENLDLATATDQLARFIETDLSDTYLQARRPALRTDRAARATLANCLRDLLLMAHPIAPFLTEQLWEALGGPDGPLDAQPWPAQGPRELDADAEAAAEIGALRDLLTAARSFRNTRRIPPATKLEARLLGLECRDELLRLANLTQTDADAADCDAEWMWFRSGAAALALRAPDHAGGRDRIRRDLERAETLRARLRARLADPAFLAKAPAHIQAKTRGDLTRAEGDADRLRGQLA